MKGMYFTKDDCVLHDPTSKDKPFLARIIPSFRVESVQPGKGFVPKFQRLRDKKIMLDRSIIELDYEELMAILLRRASVSNDAEEKHFYSLLEVLYALALRVMSCCNFCGHDCGVNRFVNAYGKCGLGHKTSCTEPFVHISEESVVNPALVINLGGCSLRCIYCIYHELWDTSNLNIMDSKIIWEKIKTLMEEETPINTLEFTNPTESLAAILDLLIKAPANFNKPIVFNCHLYGSKTFYEIAGSIVDVWLPDLRYGNDRCARKLSGVDHYMEHARLGLDEMQKSGGKVLVRILVLPGHGVCCHEPAIRMLSEYKDTWVSILDQYVPEHEAHLDPDLRRRPTKDEIREVEGLVERYGLRNISAAPETFWKSIV
jgi:putative pyruvate formate lyase activating enzyme